MSMTIEALKAKDEPASGPFSVFMDGELVYEELEWAAAVDTVCDLVDSADEQLTIKNYRGRVIVKVEAHQDEDDHLDVESDSLFIVYIDGNIHSTDIPVLSDAKELALSLFEVASTSVEVEAVSSGRTVFKMEH